MYKALPPTTKASVRPPASTQSTSQELTSKIINQLVMVNSFIECAFWVEPAVGVRVCCRLAHASYSSLVNHGLHKLFEVGYDAVSHDESGAMDHSHVRYAHVVLWWQVNAAVASASLNAQVLCCCLLIIPASHGGDRAHLQLAAGSVLLCEGLDRNDRRPARSSVKAPPFQDNGRFAIKDVGRE